MTVWGCHVLRHPKTGESWFAVVRTAFETRKGGIYFSTLEAGAEVQPTHTAGRCAALAAAKRKPRHLTDGRGFGAQAFNGAQALCGEL